MTKALVRTFCLAVFALSLCGCGDDALGRWSLSFAKATVDENNHVVVDITYVNDSDGEWQGSRCVIIEYQRGEILTREQARMGAQSKAEVIEHARWCNGGNKSLGPREEDRFRAVSAKTQPELAGSTIVVLAEDFRGTGGDDRVLLTCP